MNIEDANQRISQISTHWTAVIQAHQGTTTTAASARGALLQRYAAAVYRYLLGAVRDPDTAEELSHEFVVRMLRGDFHRASPDRGRFRDYMKKVLINLVNDHFRAQQRRPRTMDTRLPEPAAPADHMEPSDADFVHYWREELLERAWAALDDARPNYYAVLRLRTTSPDMSAREMAEHLTEQLGKPITSVTTRKTLERARTKFADLLVDEVALSLESSETAVVEAELDELDLLRYCGEALKRRS